MSAFLRRLSFVLVGLVCGGLTAGLVVPLAVAASPVLREAGGGFLVMAALAGLFDLFPGLGPWLMAKATALAWAFVILVIGAPLFVPALIAEVMAIRSMFWHAIVPGLIAALAPWASRATDVAGDAAEASNGAVEPRLVAIFFLAGCLGGLVYWRIAGRSAGRFEED
jgi:hypothetical protein